MRTSEHSDEDVIDSIGKLLKEKAIVTRVSFLSRLGGGKVSVPADLRVLPLGRISEREELTGTRTLKHYQVLTLL